jgi:hypothetical protein
MIVTVSVVAVMMAAAAAALLGCQYLYHLASRVFGN